MNFKISNISPFGVLIEPKYENQQISDIAVEEIKRVFRKEKLILLRGFGAFQSSEEFASYCDSFGEVCLWPFGKVLELVEHENPEDHIFDNSYVPMHWDGMYRPQVPEIQIFHCVKAPLGNEGGGTRFSNTVKALDNLPIHQRIKWEKLSAEYSRKMEFYNSKVKSPLITKHPRRDYSVIRYSEPHFEENGKFINPAEQNFIGLEESGLRDFHDQMKSVLYDSENLYTHRWQSGDVVIADNFSLLHGREEYKTKSSRHIQRVQVNSEEAYDNPGLEVFE